MNLPSLTGIVIPLLLVASLAAAAPAPAEPSAPPPEVIPAAPAAASLDGYQKTVIVFQSLEKQVPTIEERLRKLSAEAAAGARGDAAKQGDEFRRLLAARYPGATFDGKMGLLPLQKPYKAVFNGALKVESIRETGTITVEYLVNQSRIRMTSGDNAVTILLNQADPGRSAFISVSLPQMKEKAEKIVNIPDRRRITTDSPETVILNDAYQLMSLTSSLRMELFVANILSVPSSMQTALNVAANGYLERHAQDYRALDPEQLKKQKKIDTKPNKPADKRFYEGFLRLAAFLAAAALVIWGTSRGIRFLKRFSLTKNAQQLRQNQFDALSPMVKRALHRQGRALWGWNLPWARKYYVYERKQRWVLCDGREERENKISEARTRIEVFLRSTYFKIMISRLDGSTTNIWLHCHDTSRRDLHKGLEEIVHELKHPSEQDEAIGNREAGSAAPEPAPAPAAAPRNSP